MRTLTSAKPLARMYWIPAAALLIASCSGSGFNMNMPSLTGPAAAPPAYNADQLAGRYGLAAYQRDEDRTRTEAEARQQCRQPYEIAKGPSGGLIMHLADQSEPQELQLKGLAGGRLSSAPTARPAASRIGKSYRSTEKSWCCAGSIRRLLRATAPRSMSDARVHRARRKKPRQRRPRPKPLPKPLRKPRTHRFSWRRLRSRTTISHHATSGSAARTGCRPSSTGD